MFAEIIVFDEIAVSTAITNRPRGKCTNEQADFDKTSWPKRARPLRIVIRERNGRLITHSLIYRHRCIGYTRPPKITFFLFLVVCFKIKIFFVFLATIYYIITLLYIARIAFVRRRTGHLHRRRRATTETVNCIFIFAQRFALAGYRTCIYYIMPRSPPSPSRSPPSQHIYGLTRIAQNCTEYETKTKK